VVTGVASGLAVSGGITTCAEAVGSGVGLLETSADCAASVDGAGVDDGAFSGATPRIVTIWTL
jgi:hypothetical protein